MTDAEKGSFITAAISLIVAFISTAVSLRNSSKSNKNSLEIQDLKGILDRDLEHLKAKLSHGQLISSTQWNAEFNSYQAIWKGVVEVRTTAEKIVRRESELIKFGFPADYLANRDRIEIKKDQISKLVNAAKALLFAIHDNAPFYPAPIREAANDTHAATKYLIDIHLTAFTRFAGYNVISDDTEFMTEAETAIRAIFNRVDLVESLIRTRLEAVVIKSAYY